MLLLPCNSKSCCVPTGTSFLAAFCRHHRHRLHPSRPQLGTVEVSLRCVANSQLLPPQTATHHSIYCTGPCAGGDSRGQPALRCHEPIRGGHRLWRQRRLPAPVVGQPPAAHLSAQQAAAAAGAPRAQGKDHQLTTVNAAKSPKGRACMYLLVCNSQYWKG
jgi:hypothetical protein